MISDEQVYGRPLNTYSDSFTDELRVRSDTYPSLTLVHVYSEATVHLTPNVFINSDAA